MGRRLSSLLAMMAGLFVAIPASAQDRVLVFAAASTREAVQAVLKTAREDHGIEATGSFASSAALARQIEAGAPAHLYLSANQTWMDRLEAAGAIDAESRQDLVGNTLVLVAPKDRPLVGPQGAERHPLSSDTPLAEWLGDGRLAIGDPRSVPAGIHARRALETLGLWRRVAERLAPSADVRAALALVERAATPLGIVYATDARASDGVAVVADIPRDSHAPIRYPIALTRQGADFEPARKLFALLTSPQGLAAFAARGFSAAD